MRLQKIGLSPLAKLTVSIATLLATISASFPLSSQVPLAVSREVASSQTPDESEADNLLNHCTEHLRVKQYEAALESCQKALDTYRETKNRLGEAKALSNLGNAYFALGNYSKAIDCHQQSLTIAREIKERALESKVLNSLGDALLNQGIKQLKDKQLEPALQSLEQALNIYQEVGDRERQSKTMFSLGLVYISLRNVDYGIACLKQSLAIAEEINNSKFASAVIETLSIFQNQTPEEAVTLAGAISQLIGKSPSQQREFLRQAQVQADLQKKEAQEADNLASRGLDQFNTSQFQAALQSWEQALAIYRKIGDRLKEANTLSSIASIYAILNQHSQALELHQQALTIFKQIGDRRGEANTFNQVGKIYGQLSQYNQALEYYQQALVILKSLDNPVGQGTVLHNIAVVYHIKGQYSQALTFYQQALAIFKQHSNPYLEAQLFNNIGNIYVEQGQYSQALEFFNQSLSIAKKIGNRYVEGQALSNIGKAYGSLGQYRQALRFYQQALIIFQEIGSPNFELTVLSNMGAAYDSQGLYSQTLNSYQQALTVAREIGDRSGEGYILGNMGVIYNNLGEDSQGLELLQQAFKIGNETGDFSLKIKATQNLGSFYYLQEQYSLALLYLMQSLVLAKQTGSRAAEAESSMIIGSLNGHLGQYSEAIKFIQQALVIFRELGDRSNEGLALSSIGKVYQLWDKHSDALKFFQQSSAIQRSLGERANEADTYNMSGYSLLKAGQLKEAESKFLKSIQLRESLRSGVENSLKVSLIDKQNNAYVNLRKALVLQNKTYEALEINERNRTRVFLELLAKRLSHQSDYQISISAPKLEQIKEIAQIEKATIVDYSIIYDDTSNDADLYIWVIYPTGKIVFRHVDLKSLLGNPKILITDLIPRVRQSINARSAINTNEPLFKPGDRIYFKGEKRRSEPWEVVSFDPQSGILRVRLPSFTEGVTIPKSINDVEEFGQTSLQKLHQILIQPIADLLPTNPSDRVIFIPQAQLFLVPFPALQDANGDYLIKKHTILTAPSIQVLESTHKLRHSRQISPNAPVLVVGNPSPMPNQYSPLPYAEKEATDIASLFNTKAIIGTQATETSIVAQMSNARVIHLATHGEFDNMRGLGSAIALAPSEKDNGLLTAEEILNLKLNAELVVLSACDTGRGRLTGDGVIGLSRSLIAAGVPSVVVSLWKVPDDTTAGLMSEFYRQLQQNPDKAQALRQAMLKTMEKHPQPKNWAAFTLIGEAE